MVVVRRLRVWRVEKHLPGRPHLELCIRASDAACSVQTKREVDGMNSDNQKSEEWNVVHGWMCAIDFAYELRDADGGARILPSERNCQKHLPCTTRNNRDHRAIEVVVMPVEYYNSLSHVTKKDDEVAEERRRRQAGKTHWDGCWKDHLDCAVEKIEAREAEAKTASAVVNPYPHNSKERDLFNEGFFAGYLKDSEAEKVRRLVKAATEVERISSRDHNAWAELRSALDALKGGSSYD